MAQPTLFSRAANYRIPGELVSTFHKLVNTPEGNTAMKRIRVECGVCRLTRFYSIHRGITRISGVVSCEACRQFYQRFKKQPWKVKCAKGGNCLTVGDFPKTKCKSCWMGRILAHCPIPENLYTVLSSHVDDGVRNQLLGRPLQHSEVGPEQRGALGLEMLKEGQWLDVTEQSELDQYIRDQDEDDEDMDYTGENEMDVDEDQHNPDDPAFMDAMGEDAENVGRGARRIKKPTKTKSIEETMTQDKNLVSTGQNKFMKDFNPKTSERVRRKKKKVQYYNDNSINRSKTGQIEYYAGDGSLLGTGKNICDCLQEECVGCHFPCPKCRSPKCGAECRNNRKWYYDRVEVEGTGLIWLNKWVKK